MPGLSLGTAVGYLTLDATGFARGIDTAAASMSSLQGKANTLNGALQTVGGALTGAGTRMTAGFTLPIAAAGVASIKTAADFEYAMARVGAVTSTAGDDLKVLSDRAIELSKTTRYTSTEVSDAMYYMGLAGWKSNEIFDNTSHILSLAAASGEDLSRVSDIVTDSLTAMGYTACDTESFVNVLAETMRSSNTDVDQMGEAFKYVAPLAGALGYSIEDLALLLGTAANNGIKASQAGTSARQAFKNLISPTEKTANAMKKYNIALFDSTGNAYPLRKVMGDLRQQFGDLGIEVMDASGEIKSGEQIMQEYGDKLPITQMEKLQAVVDLFGVRALPEMLAVIQASESEWNDLSIAIDGAQDSYDGLGTSMGMQQQMMDTVQGDWWIFTSALKAAATQVGELSKGPIRELLQSLTDLVNKFTELTPEQQMFIIKMAGIVAAIGPAMMILGRLISGFGTLRNNLSLLGTAFNTLRISAINVGEGFKLARAGFTGFAAEASPLGAALSGITAPMIALVAIIGILIAAFVSLWKNNEEFRNNMLQTWNELKESVGGSIQKILDAVNSLGFDFQSITELLGSLWDGFCSLLAPAFEGVWSIISGKISAFAEIFAGVIEIVCGLLNGDWEQAWQGAKDVVQGWWNGVKSTLEGIAHIFWGQLQVITDWLGLDWNTSWSDAKTAVSDFVNGIIEWITGLPEQISETIGGILDTIGEFVNGIIEWFQGLPEQIGEIWNNIVLGIQNFVNNAILFFQELPYNIGFIIGKVLGDITLWSVMMVLKAIELGQQFIGNIIKFFQELPRNVLQFINDTYNKVKDWAKKMIDKAIELGKNFLKNVIDFFRQLPTNIAIITAQVLVTIVAWVKSMINKAIELGKNFVKNIITFFQQLPSKIATIVSNVLTKVIQWAKNMINKAKEMARNFVNAVVNGLKVLPGKVVSIGTDVVRGLWSGISAAGGWLRDQISGFCSGIIEGFKASFKIHSPSRVMKDEIGKNLALGVAQGIKENAHVAENAAEEMAGKILSYAKKTIDNYKVYHKVSLADEVEYWNKVRKQVQKGTDARVEADKNYLDAKRELNSQIKSLDQQYADDYSAIATKLVEDIDAVEKAYEDALNNRANAIASSIALFKEFEVQDTITKDKLLENIQSQVNGLARWDEALDKIASREGMDKELLAELQAMGVDSVGTLEEINKMSDEELAKYIELYHEKRRIAMERSQQESADLRKQADDNINELKKNAKKQISSLQKQYKKDLKALGVDMNKGGIEVGNSMVSGIISGIKSQTSAAEQAMEELISKLNKKAKDEAEVGSPSRLFAREVGQWIPLGIAQGAREAIPRTVNDMQKTFNTIIDRVNVPSLPISDVLTDVSDTLKGTYEKVSDWFISVEETIVNSVDNMVESLGTLVDLQDTISGDGVFIRGSENRAIITGNNGVTETTVTNNYNFTTDQPIDEIEAARQLRRTQRDLAEGFA